MLSGAWCTAAASPRSAAHSAGRMARAVRRGGERPPSAPQRLLPPLCAAMPWRLRPRLPLRRLEARGLITWCTMQVCPGCLAPASLLLLASRALAHEAAAWQLLRSHAWPRSCVAQGAADRSTARVPGCSKRLSQPTRFRGPCCRCRRQPACGGGGHLPRCGGGPAAAQPAGAAGPGARGAAADGAAAPGAARGGGQHVGWAGVPPRLAGGAAEACWGGCRGLLGVGQGAAEACWG